MNLLVDLQKGGTTQSATDETPRRQDTGGRWLHANGPGGLANGGEDSREWLFPEVDEVFRGIYTRAGTGFAAEVLAICSAIAGEGKTSVAVGLAVSIAQDFPERRVLLVETDLQRPVLAEDFGIDMNPGLVECFLADAPLLSVCRPTFIENLHILPSGAPASVPGRPLRSGRMATIVDEMRQNYDVAILDLPPILSNSDAILLTDLADGVICVVRAGITPMALVNRAIEQVEQSKLRGVVLNSTVSSVPSWLRRLAGM